MSEAWTWAMEGWWGVFIAIVVFFLRIWERSYARQGIDYLLISHLLDERLTQRIISNSVDLYVRNVTLRFHYGIFQFPKVSYLKFPITSNWCGRGFWVEKHLYTVQESRSLKERETRWRKNTHVSTWAWLQKKGYKRGNFRAVSRLQ